uniref:Uncharacterized protein n=1 Tax=Glossina austeni TaxID=7395 RepID=A0A1A9UEQ8_GLOAU
MIRFEKKAGGGFNQINNDDGNNDDDDDDDDDDGSDGSMVVDFLPLTLFHFQTSLVKAMFNLGILVMKRVFLIFNMSLTHVIINICLGLNTRFRKISLREKEIKSDTNSRKSFGESQNTRRNIEK